MTSITDAKLILIFVLFIDVKLILNLFVHIPSVDEREGTQTAGWH